ncbi:hypothetical protein TrLO_g5430 [Triparma laevis f. longispina]|uniref:Uncharacterized protein n=1 Tax=Triparma laevis f. longispina TaxID=1714387 RepID=A0A9W6ZPV9_9STRA|nr:hypothetical protein TrLO_g5430 [Triparma laevis f. longispina]
MGREPSPAVAGFTFPVVCNATSATLLQTYWSSHPLPSFSPSPHPLLPLLSLYLPLLLSLSLLTCLVTTIIYFWKFTEWCDILLPGTAFVSPRKKGSLVVAGKRNRRTGSDHNFWVWSKTLSPSIGFVPTPTNPSKTIFAFD